jgi:RNA polymerase sigma-70 factor (ECF subfamily)
MTQANDKLANYVEDIYISKSTIAFSSVFEHFAPRLKNYFFKLGSSEAAAEEIIQEVMHAVWVKAGSYDRKKASVSTWIFTIARNKRIDILRKEKRHLITYDDSLLEIPVDASQEEKIYTNEISNNIANVIDLLPKKQKELIKLSYFYDKSHNLIAKELNLPLGTVKSRIRLALSKLRNLITEKNDV